MPTNPTAISALPAAPNPDDDESVFDSAAYAWSAALSNFRTQTNAIASVTYTNAQEAVAAASAAALSATAATTNGAAQVALAANQVTLATTQAGIATNKAVLTTADAVATAGDRVQTGLDRTAAAASAASAAAIAGAFVGTSATSVAIGSGNKTFATQAGEQYTPGIFMTAVSAANPANYMAGQLVSYSGTSAVINVTVTGGSGTYANWNLSLAGPQGATGPQGPTGTLSGTAVGAINWNGTVTLASAGTVGIGVAASNDIIISGTTTITSFDGAAQGATRKVRFTGALTLTHNAVIVLPGNANITTAANDCAQFTSLGGGNWICDWYKKADGKAVVAPAGMSVIRSARVSNAILGTADNGTLIDITSGTFTQTVTAAAALGNGWFCWIRNSGAGDITLDPNASELIDGIPSYVMYPGECRLIQCDGSAFNSIVLSPFYRSVTSSIIFISPPGYTAFGVKAWGAGGSGCGGTGNAAGTQRWGGAAGGGGGFNQGTISLTPGANVAVTVAAATTGGAGATGGAYGLVGGNGGSSYFGSYVTAYGGGGGGVGGNQEGGGGGGAVSASNAYEGGEPRQPLGTATKLGSVIQYFWHNVGYGGGANVSNAPAFGKVGTTEFGGSGGGCSQPASGGAKSLFGATGGGGGGALDSTNSAYVSPGSGGGVGFDLTSPGSGAPGNSNGVAQGPLRSGGGGGGGSANPGGTGYAGGAGATPGGGGGGGGGGLTTGGAGGNGGAGLVIVWGIA